MKADELKTLLKDYSKDELIKLYSRTYRMVPKERRETELDEMIRNPEVKTVPKKKTLDFDVVKEDVLLFESEARQQLYLRRNRGISEKRRRNWRFDVKRNISFLEQIPEGDENHTAATELLLKIYDVLSTGCGIWLFSTDQPFQSVGIPQAELFETLCRHVLAEPGRPEFRDQLIRQACACSLDAVTLHQELISILVSIFDTQSLRDDIITRTKKIILEEKKKIQGRNSRYIGSEDYWIRDSINKFTLLVLYALILSEKAEEGCTFFWENDQNDPAEVSLNILLNVLKLFKRFDLWVKEYENAVRKRKINPRDSLKKEYAEFKEYLALQKE
ncbi:MAG: hypothetical protein IKD69_10680 [Solobacterium sp.]|nr:hypothetical protein [Solobacterium sp.]